MTPKVKAILKNILDDIRSDSLRDRMVASSTLENQIVVDLLLEAGCPEETLVHMRQTLELGSVAREFCVKQLITRLKKIPTD